MRVFMRVFAALSASTLVAVPVLAGPDWVEVGDAGSLLSSAQRVVGINNLSRITGSLGAGTSTGAGDPDSTAIPPDYEDLYLIRIAVPSTFTFELNGAAFNAQLYLFNITLAAEAFGLLASDDRPMTNSPLLQSPATDATGAQVLLPGTYAIGVAGFGRVPVSIGGPIFFFASSTEISGADGPGGLNPLIGWEGVGDTGEYLVNVRGIDFVDIPAPSSAITLLGLAGVCRRRRSR